MADETRSTLRQTPDEPARDDDDRLALADDARAGGPGSTGGEVAPREPEALRPYLAPIETERQVTDWGRSERVEGFFDRTLIDFYYNLWFRCEVEGIEHVPSAGGALLVSNHSGALPP